MRWTYAAGWRPNLWKDGLVALRQKGFVYVARLAVLWATFPLWRLALRTSARTVRLNGTTYPLFFHNHNLTWSNERQVELAVGLDLLARFAGRRILEVGNVLAHYRPISHTVLDKFEANPGVINEDVATFRSGERYDLILSISTLEHVGWDEEPRDPGKILVAIENLRDHLAPGGELWVTLPLGYNPPLDELLARNALPFTHRYFLRRRGWFRWQEVTWEGVAGATYGETWPAASGLAFGAILPTTT